MSLTTESTRKQHALADYATRNIDMQVAQCEGRHAEALSAADVRIVRPRFLDDPMIPLGVITLISGRAGVSKSTLSIHRAAMATCGRLEGDYKGRPINVAFSATEDSLSMQKARLVAADADMSKVRFITMQDTHDGITTDTGMTIPDDLPMIRRIIKDNDIKLWIIDPITSCITGDTNKRDDVRTALDPLAALADDLGIAIVGILHFNKGGGYSSDKVSGSHAFRDIARSLILVVRDDDTGDCVMTIDKSSYSMAQGTSYSYALMSCDVPTDDGDIASVPKVTGFMRSDRDVNEVLNRNYSQSSGVEVAERAERNEVIGWLVDYLSSGPAAFAEIEKAAKAEGYTKKQLRNAKQRASSPWVVSVRDSSYEGRGQRYLWQLSDTEPEDTD